MRRVTSTAMRALEAASGRAGVPPGQLLEHAGLAIARSAERLTGGARGRTVLALIGKGNHPTPSPPCLYARSSLMVQMRWLRAVIWRVPVDGVCACA